MQVPFILKIPQVLLVYHMNYVCSIKISQFAKQFKLRIAIFN